MIVKVKKSLPAKAKAIFRDMNNINTICFTLAKGTQIILINKYIYIFEILFFSAVFSCFHSLFNDIDVRLIIKLAINLQQQFFFPPSNQLDLMLSDVNFVCKFYLKFYLRFR